jgi:hypothetical protein
MPEETNQNLESSEEVPEEEPEVPEKTEVTEKKRWLKKIPKTRTGDRNAPHKNSQGETRRKKKTGSRN